MSPKLNPLQIRSHRIEYETTDITLEQLRMKYNLPESLDTSSWVKEFPTTNILQPVVITKPAPPEPDQENSSSVEIEEMMSDIHKFKQLTVTKALNFMSNDAEWAEVKEIKDMVAIVDSIEKSIRPQLSDKPVGVTVQVLVQNLMSEFKRDC